MLENSYHDYMKDEFLSVIGVPEILSVVKINPVT